MKKFVGFVTFVGLARLAGAPAKRVGLLAGLILLLPSSVSAVSCGLSDNATNTLNTSCVIDGPPFTEGGSSYYSGIANGDMVVSGADVTVSPGVTMTWSPGKAIMIQNGGRIIRGANAVLKQVDPMAWFRQQLGFDTYAAGVPVKILGQNLHVCTADPCTVTAPAGAGNLIVENAIKFADGTTQTTSATSSAGLAQGSIVFYNGSSCPSGYNEVTGARGRTVVGLPAAGTLAGTVGTALTNLEDRTHTHTGPNHTHAQNVMATNKTLGGGQISMNGSTGNNETFYTAYTESAGSASVPGSGVSASGTGATGTAATSNVIPYVQYIVCEAASGAGASGNGWNDLGSTVVLATTGDSVGIGTTSVTSKLTVAGTVESTTGGFKFPDATTQTSAASGVPATGVMFFNAASCPSGWTELTAARGMTMVGLPAAGTLAGTVGTALTNLEDRTHTHTGPSHTHTGPSHTHSGPNHTHTISSNYVSEGHSQSPPLTLASGQTTSSNGTGATSADGTGATSASGTGATGTAATSNVMPYIQLLACQKS